MRINSSSKKYNKLTSVKGIMCSLELGKWGIAEVNKLLNAAWDKYQDPSDRISYIMLKFLGTPFIFESNLPILPKGILRVRLESFDCITFIYAMLALGRSKNFDEFVINLYQLRYKDSHLGLIDNDPDTGNILDFACDSILINGYKNKLLKDITLSVVHANKLEELSIELKRCRRPSMYDSNETFVTPKYGERVVSEKFITAKSVAAIDISTLKSGDLMLFSRGEVNKKGIKENVLIGHLAFVYLENGNLYFIHSTKHFAWREDANLNSAPLYTGIFYDEEHKKEQLGVSFGAEFINDELTVHMDGFPHYALDHRKKCALSDYLEKRFWGVKFLRVL